MGVDIQPMWKIRFAKWGLHNVKKILFVFVKIAFPGIDRTKHSVIIPQGTYSPWLIDENFNEIYQKIKNFTKLNEYRMYELWKITEQIKKFGGDIIQIGVWRGGSGCLLAKKSKLDNNSSTVYLCDTFEGVVKAGEKDEFYTGGEHADTSKETVENLAQKLSLDNVKILKGIFPDDTGHSIEHARFGLCHIDVDSYDSAKDILDWIWDKMVINGIIVFDDYGIFSVFGVKKFVDKIMKNNKDFLFINNYMGQCILIKK